MMGKEKKLVLVREQDNSCVGFFKFFLENEGYAVHITNVHKFPMDLERDPLVAITFWGTTPLGEEHPLYGLSSRAFCSECISRGIPFVIVTRWPHAVPEHFAERAVTVLEKVFYIEEIYQVLEELSHGTGSAF